MKSSWLIASSLLVGIALLASILDFGSKEKLLTVAFLDVGQGDAIFIETPNGVQVLIDGGPDRSVLAGLSELMSWRDRKIDILIATHPDKDHIAGLLPVFDAYEVEHFITAGSLAETDVFSGLYEKVIAEDASVALVRRGSEVILEENIVMEVLWPEQVFDITDRNINSLVLKLTYGDTSFLLTGDAGIEQEAYLVSEYGSSLKSDVLKLGHHGADTSSSEVFLQTVSPEVAVASFGVGNFYGHPSPEVMERAWNLGIEVFSTEQGSLVFQSDGKQVYLQK